MNLAQAITETAQDYDALQLVFPSELTLGEFILSTDEFALVQQTLHALLRFHDSGDYGRLAGAVALLRDNTMVSSWVSDYETEQDDGDAFEGEED